MAGGVLAPRGVLVYGEVPIRDRGEMLNLTDMWKAAGADPQQTPAKWRALPEAKAFALHVEVTIGKSDSLFETKQGRCGGTFAHWQIGLAYAKYLSPEFHMWCNATVRAHMEARGLAPQVAVPAAVSLTEESLDRFARIVGQASGEAAAAKCVELMDTRMQTALAPIEMRLARLEQATPERRRRPSPATLSELFYAAHALGDRCPCCGINHVTSPTDGARAVGVEVDHFFRSSHADADHCWPICKPCHNDLTAGRMSRTEAERQFHAFQSRRRRLPVSQPKLFG